MMRVGSLFAGIGGLDLGLERAGMTVVWQVEQDDYATRVLAKRWPDVQRFRDVRDCGAHNLQPVDLICGGFPCQDVSLAGKRAGLEGERTTLWSEFARIVRELEPRWVLAENVPGLLSSDAGRFFGQILRDLAACGYDAEWDCIPAAAVGAPHRRDRVFVVAYATQHSLKRETGNDRGEGPLSIRQAQPQWRESAGGRGGQPQVNAKASLADADQPRLALWQNKAELRQFAATAGACQWATEPDVGGAFDGISSRLDGPGRLTDDAHKPILSNVIDTLGGIDDANATEARPGEVLPDMRGEAHTQGEQRTARGLGGIQSSEALQPDMCEYAETAEALGDLPLEGEALPGGSLRGMRDRDELACSSHRRSPTEQRPGEHSDALRALPRIFTQDGKTSGLDYSGTDAWAEGWEDGIPRVATGVPSRVDRLRCLGNAVVPQVAEWIGRHIMRADVCGATWQDSIREQ